MKGVAIKTDNISLEVKPLIFLPVTVDLQAANRFALDLTPYCKN